LENALNVDVENDFYRIGLEIAFDYEDQNYLHHDEPENYDPTDPENEYLDTVQFEKTEFYVELEDNFQPVELEIDDSQTALDYVRVISEMENLTLLWNGRAESRAVLQAALSSVTMTDAGQCEH